MRRENDGPIDLSSSLHATAPAAAPYHGGAVRAWLSVAILVLLAVIASLDRSLMSLLVDPIRRDLKVTDFDIGLVNGLGFGLFYAAFGVPVGWLADRFPKRWIIYLGVTFWSLAAAATGLARSFGALMAARLGLGAGEAALIPAGYALISRIFPKRRLGLAIGVFGAGSSIGAGISLGLGGAIADAVARSGPITLPVLGTLQPWQQVFILIGSPGLALGLLALLLPEPPDVSQKVAKPAQGADGFSAFFRSRAAFFTCHFLGFGGLAIVGFGMISWAPVFAMRHYGLSAGQAGLFIGLIHSVCGIAGYVFHGWFSDRLFAAGIKDIHLRYYIVTYAAGCVIGGMLFAASLPIWMFAIGYGVLGFLQPFSGPAATALQLVTPFRYRARISALFLLAQNGIGLCLGPVMVAAFTDFVFHDPARVGSSLSLMFLTVSPVVILPLIIGLKPAREAQREGAFA